MKNKQFWTEVTIQVSVCCELSGKNELKTRWKETLIEKLSVLVSLFIRVVAVFFSLCFSAGVECICSSRDTPCNTQNRIELHSETIFIGFRRLFCCCCCSLVALVTQTIHCTKYTRRDTHTQNGKNTEFDEIPTLLWIISHDFCSKCLWTFESIFEPARSYATTGWVTFHTLIYIFFFTCFSIVVPHILSFSYIFCYPSHVLFMINIKM